MSNTIYTLSTLFGICVYYVYVCMYMHIITMQKEVINLKESKDGRFGSRKGKGEYFLGKEKRKLVCLFLYMLTLGTEVLTELH